MVKKEKELNSKTRDILIAIHRKGGAMSAHEIARETGMSYITIRKYIEQMIKKEVLIEHENKKISEKTS